MADKPRIEFNSAMFRAILTGAEVRADLEDRAGRIESAAGEGFEASVTVGSNRVRASVITATPEAMREEAENGTLSRAIGAAGG